MQDDDNQYGQQAFVDGLKTDAIDEATPAALLCPWAIGMLNDRQLQQRVPELEGMIELSI